MAEETLDFPGIQETGPDFPGLVHDQGLQQSQQHGALNEARVTADNNPSGVGGFFGRRSVPFVSAGVNAAETAAHRHAMERFNAGTPRDGDYATIAEHEQRQRQDADINSTMGGQVGSMIATLPAMAGESYAGGGLIGAGARMAGARLGIGAATSLAGRGAAAVGSAVAATPLMPSMYAQDWQQRGGSAADLGGALTHAAMLNVVLGGASQVIPGIAGQAAKTGLIGAVGRTAARLDQPTIAAAVGRAAAGAGVMAAGAPVANALSYAVGASPHKDAMLKWLSGEGEGGAAAQQAALDAITGAAFSLLHQPHRPQDAHAIINDFAQRFMAEGVGRGAETARRPVENVTPLPESSPEAPGSPPASTPAEATVEPSKPAEVAPAPSGEVVSPPERPAAGAQENSRGAGFEALQALDQRRRVHEAAMEAIRERERSGEQFTEEERLQAENDAGDAPGEADLHQALVGDGLTDREAKVMVGLTAQKSYRELASELGMSRGTVNNDVKSITEKLGKSGHPTVHDLLERIRAENAASKQEQGAGTNAAVEGLKTRTRGGAEAGTNDTVAKLYREAQKAYKAWRKASAKDTPETPALEQAFREVRARYLEANAAASGAAGSAEPAPGATEPAPGDVNYHRGAGGQQAAGGAAGRAGSAGAAVRPNTIAEGLREVLAPATRGQEAGTAGGILRQNLAELARRKAIAQAELAKVSDHFEKTMVSLPDDAARTVEFLHFTDAIEGGKIDTLPDHLRPAAQSIREALDSRSRQLEQRGMMDKFIDNYLGHLWEKPGSTLNSEDIGKILGGRRPLAGSEGFMKKRTMPTYRDGIDAGLKPKTWNPIELAQMKMFEIDKSILMGHDVPQEMKANGLMKYMQLGAAAPEGWRSINDKLARVFAPPEAKVKEYVDKQQMEGLERFARSLGVDVKTSLTGAPGQESAAGIVRRFGTQADVLAHEIGHKLDRDYKIGDTILRAPGPIQAEMTALADLRSSGQVSPEYQAYIRSRKEQVANLVAAYIHAPELLKSTAPTTAKWFENFLNKPELRALRDVKPSLELGEREAMMRLAGPQLVGNYYFPEPVATLLENHLSPGFGGNKVYNVAREYSNVLNGFQLGMSAFHGGFVAMDTQVSALGLGLQLLSRGEFAKGAKMVIGSPLAPFRAWIEGSKMLKEYYKPGSQGAETAAIMEQFIKAGGRAKMDEFYGGSHFSNFRKAFREVAAGDYKKTGSLLYQALPAMNEILSKPIMEMLVPRMKAGVFADMARAEMGRVGNQHVNVQREVYGKAWDSVENRLGQLTYDNLFWHKALKDTLMVGVRSVGWNVGTWRELGGGIKDVPASLRGLGGAGISPRTAYVVALPMMTALYGAMYQYLATGKGPEEPKDYFFPKTGRTRRDGSADRVSLPSYMRDVAALVNRGDEGPMRWAQNMATMASHKINPGLTTTWEMLTNEDFHGTAIRNPNDPWVQQAWDTAKHLLGAFESFSVRGARQAMKDTGNLGQAAQGFVGVTPAPAYVTRSWQQQRAIETSHPVTMSPQERRRRGL